MLNNAIDHHKDRTLYQVNEELGEANVKLANTKEELADVKKELIDAKLFLTYYIDKYPDNSMHNLAKSILNLK